MDAAVRHLRDGALPDSPACATCCVLDTLGVIGGALILNNALQSFISAMRQGRSQAVSIRLVDLTGTLADAAQQFTVAPAPASVRLQRTAAAADVEVIDLYSDPWGWRQALSSGGDAPPAVPPSASQPAPHTASGPQPSLDALKAALLKPVHQQPARNPAAGTAPPPPMSPAAQPTDPSQPQAPGVGDTAPVAASGSSVPGVAGGWPSQGAAAEAPPAADSRSVCVVISCLSSLMERYGEWQSLALLEAVQRSPLVSCVLTSLHTDMHPEQVVFGLRRLCSCSLELSQLTPLQAEVAQRAVAGAAAAGVLAGRLDCRTKRRTGRVKVESELYSLLLPPPPELPPASSPPPGMAASPPCRLHFFPAPPFLHDLPDPRVLVKLQPQAAAAAATGAAAAAPAASVAGAQAAAGPAAAAASGPGKGGNGGGGGQAVGLLGGVGSAEELARAVGSSMRLTLTEEERRAKQQVVLPYQHQGQHRGPAAEAYAAGDHRAYLPPAAGGIGPAAGGSGQQALGHILYVRDSASEADSDQDLDEDLDI